MKARFVFESIENLFVPKTQSEIDDGIDKIIREIADELSKSSFFESDEEIYNAILNKKEEILDLINYGFTKSEIIDKLLGRENKAKYNKWAR